MKILSSFLILLLWPFSVQAVNPLDVVINEIAWMGTTVSYNDEWIEFYNNTGSPINLDGWVLKAKDGTPKINLRGTVSGNGFFLLERTDDNTLPNIQADQIYTGALGNSGENLELYDNFGNLIDSLNCSSGWFTGDNTTKQTMERINPQISGKNSDNWGTSQNPGGTPKARNSVIIGFLPPPEERIIEPEAQLEPESKPLPRVEDYNPPTTLPEGPSKPIIYPSGIVFNEILPSPEGPDEEEEWIEVFNRNDFEVNLSGWQIVDLEGKTKTYTFSNETEIFPQEFLVIPRPESKITLNNDGDGLNLIRSDGKIIDSVSYESAPRGQSYNRVESGWVWSNVLTPGLSNRIPTPEIKEEPSKELIKEIAPSSFSVDLKEISSATVSKNFPKEKVSFPSYLVAFSVAIFSAITIFILKRNVEKLKKID